MAGRPNTRSQQPQPKEPQRGPRLHRNPYVEKRALQRKAARVRAMAHVRVPLTTDYHSRRGLRLMPSWLRATVGILVLLVSVGLHVAFVITAFGISRLSGQENVTREQVAIEVREREAKPKEPPPPPKEPEPEAKPERAVPVRQAPVVKVEAQPKETPKAQPARVVGLSFESTVGEGDGDGPAFGVGNTRMGDTAKIAAPPKDVPKQVVDKGPTTVKPVANAVATRIPVAGVTFTKPKAKLRKEPVYPAILKTQGLEADVEVLVFISAEGKVTSVKILKEAPYPEFNEAAKQAALEQEFEPATRNGEPIPYTLPYTIRFRLTDQ